MSCWMPPSRWALPRHLGREGVGHPCDLFPCLQLSRFMWDHGDVAFAPLGKLMLENFRLEGAHVSEHCRQIWGEPTRGGLVLMKPFSAEPLKEEDGGQCAEASTGPWRIPALGASG